VEPQILQRVVPRSGTVLSSLRGALKITAHYPNNYPKTREPRRIAANDWD
jgi:hypothetical protein